MNSGNHPDSDREQNAEFDLIVDEILLRQRSGPKPSLEEFVQRYPRHAEELREIYSTLLMVEQLEPSRSTAEPPSPMDPKRQMVEEFPNHLGDFELLQELGRGGMGVVFAARQTTLDRPVAVKILSRHLAANPQFAARFLRESQSAAKLQHANIVAVYGNGTELGYSYYAMQLIEGENLNEVLHGVRQLRREAMAAGNGAENSEMKPVPIGEQSQGEESAAEELWQRDSLSRQLLTGDLTQGANSSLAESSLTSSPSRSSANHAVDSQLRKQQLTASLTSGQRADSSSWQPNERRRYFKNIASLIRDCALALDYAHSHGTVHRDIKPSNLILDHAGTIWITDFGLAKLESDKQLTRAGDVLGTLRYLAPEQLRGVSAPSCDIYGLGATLYELVTLRPAHDGRHHAELLESVRSQEPARPRLIDAAVPLDLETIIVTAMAKDPLNRYRSAKELADDLDRFLDDIPIKARKVSTAETLWRWSQRNRTTALAITATILLFAVVLPTITTIYAFILREKMGQIQAAESKSEALHLESQQRLAESLILQARAQRKSQLPDSQLSALAAITEARDVLTQTDLHGPHAQSLARDLRNEAVAALATPEIRTDFEIPLEHSVESSTSLIGMSGDWVILTRRRADGVVSTNICAQDNLAQPIFTVPFIARSAYLTRDKLHFVTELEVPYDASTLTIWSLQTKQALKEFQVRNQRWKVSADERRIVALNPAGAISVFEFSDNHLRSLRPLRNHNENPEIASNHDGTLLAIVFRHQISIAETKTGKQVKRLRPSRRNVDFEKGVWSPAGDWFAAKSLDGAITVFDTDRWSVMRTLATDSIQGTQLSASCDGRYLMAQSWTRRLQVWDLVTGREICSVLATVQSPFLNLYDFQIGPICSYDRATVLRLQPSRVYRVFNTVNDVLVRPQQLDLSPNGHVAALSLNPAQNSVHGLAILNLHNGRIEVTGQPYDHPTFDSAGNLWANQNGNVSRWIARNREGSLQFTNQKFLFQLDSTVFAMNPSASLFAHNLQRGVAITQFDPSALQTLPRTKVRKLYGDIRRLEVSPDGKWVVGAGHNEAGCTVYDTSSDRSWNLAPEFVLTNPRFSLDSQFLAVVVPGQNLRLYKTGDWKAPIRTWGLALGQPAFSPDARLLAVSLNAGSISLLDTESGAEVLQLAHPESINSRIHLFSRDGRKLYFISTESNGLHCWNIDELQRSLGELDLIDNYPWPALVSMEQQAAWQSLSQSQKTEAPLRIDFEPDRKLERSLILEYQMARRQGKPAKEILEKLVALDGDNPSYANDLAWYIATQQTVERAELLRALELSRQATLSQIDNADFRNTFAKVVFELGDYEEAALSLQAAQSLRENGDTSIDDYLLSKVNFRSGKDRAACSRIWWQGVRSQWKHAPLDLGKWMQAMDACYEISK